MNAHPSSTGPRTRRRRSRRLFLVGILCWGLVFVGRGRSEGMVMAVEPTTQLEAIPFDGARAFDHLKQICALGPRSSGSPGMAAQQQLLQSHFTKLGGQVELQRFLHPHPLNGQPVPMANLLVRWHPQRAERILLCTHYDTLPFPLRDPRNPRGAFLGANDGGSGTALLMELGSAMPKLASKYGVDFAFFDAEEFIFQESQARYFIGSEHFARNYAQDRAAPRYRWAVLLDMVGDADLELYQERNSLWTPAGRELVASIWAVAHRLGVKEFILRAKHEVRDDHLPLMEIGGITACDIIDFDYPHWHTQADTPDKCSPLSLAKVGWVVSEWLKTRQ